jgi:hypothetical protein
MISRIDDESSDVEDYMFYDAQEGEASAGRDWADPQPQRSVSNDIKNAAGAAVMIGKASTAYSSLVPCVVQVDDVRRSVIGMRRELYVFCIPKTILYPDASSASSAESGGDDKDISSSCLVTMRSYKEFEATFLSVSPAPETNVSTRLHRMEKRRRDLQETMEQLLSTCTTDKKLFMKMRQFFKESIHINQFLLSKQKGGGVSSAQKRSDIAAITMGSLVCVRSGQTIWSEEYMCLTTNSLIFVKPASTLLGANNRLVILLVDIRSVKILDSKYWPFYLDKCYILVVSTLTRVYHVLVRGVDLLNAWVSAISSALDAYRPPDADELQVGSSDDAQQKWVNFQNLELFTLPMDWKLGDRVILNGRLYNGRHCFEQPLDHAYSDDLKASNTDLVRSSEVALDHTTHIFPLVLVERSLDLVFSLSEHFDRGDLSGDRLTFPPLVEAQWIEFLTNIAYLPCINLANYSFSDSELTCLFINLYHIMVLHSFLVAGVPSTLLKWPSFFNSCSYEAFGDIFSLSELEHCIIKAGADN